MTRVTTFDPRVPSIARVYDFLLGGKDNFAADRAVAHKLLAVYPPIIETVPESRRFAERAVTWVAGQGITQFIDLGAGLPTAPNTHVTAQTASPAAAVAGSSTRPTTRAGSPRCTTTHRRISRRFSTIWRSSPPDSATRGRSVPAGASWRRCPRGPTGYSRASPGCRNAHHEP